MFNYCSLGKRSVKVMDMRQRGQDFPDIGRGNKHFLLQKNCLQKSILASSKNRIDQLPQQMTAQFDQQNMTLRQSADQLTFASEAGGAGCNPGGVIPKTLKMVPVATLLGAQH